jgi:hypothetical protein
MMLNVTFFFCYAEKTQDYDKEDINYSHKKVYSKGLVFTNLLMNFLQPYLKRAQYCIN